MSLSHLIVWKINEVFLSSPLLHYQKTVKYVWLFYLCFPHQYPFGMRWGHHLTHTLNYFFFFFKKTSFLCITILSVYMSDKNMCACCPSTSEESIVSSGTESLESCEPLGWIWALNPGPLEEQPVLWNMQTSLQPYTILNYALIWIICTC